MREELSLFMKDYTEDLTEYSINNAWKQEVAGRLE